MPRIAGIDVPDNKPLRISMRYIYGIGPKFAEEILKEADLDGQMRAKELTEDDIAKINGIIEGGYVIEGAL
ncbi:MAG: 30S ribosomal protein S13, partial [Planctomycetota bacterium]